MAHDAELVPYSAWVGRRSEGWRLQQYQALDNQTVSIQNHGLVRTLTYAQVDTQPDSHAGSSLLVPRPIDASICGG